MSITKRQAIRECKKLWKEIVESGLSKWGFLLRYPDWVAKKGYSCPLCAYTSMECGLCPLVLQFKKTCSDLEYNTDPTYFYSWVKKLKE